MSDAEDDDVQEQRSGNDSDRRENQAFTIFYAAVVKAGSNGPPTLRVFEQRQGEYFTAHGSDAESIADEFFNTREVLKYTGDENHRLATVNIRPQKLETILKHALLQNKQNVEMYVKEAGTNSWSLSKKASPGNLQSFEDLLFHRGEMTENVMVMACRLVTAADCKVCY
jgi:DNA mismatch repair protein MSH2